MRVIEGLLGPGDLRRAVDVELDSPPALLPASAIHPALTTVRDELAEWAGGRLAGSFSPTLEEIVPVSKPHHGVRPVAIWDLPSRLLYQALCSRLAEQLPPFDRSRTAWREFQRWPLAQTGSYVVATDVAACYQHIDHGLLARELLVQTGDHTAVECIRDLLQETSGRTYGLPQQSHASDVLAERFLDLLERSLLRRGLTVARYNDDFRFCCDTWSGVVRALEVFSEESRKLGLTVNDLKTVTWGWSKYEHHLDEGDRLRASVASEAELDLTQYDVHPYTDAVIETLPSADDVDLLASIRILKMWEDVAGSGEVADSDRARYRAVLELLPFAIATLGTAEGTDETTLNRSMQLLRFERTLTPSVCRYLMNRGDEGMLLAAFDALLASDAYLNGWQTWWLQQPLARLSSLAAGPGAAARLAWAHAALASSEQTPALRLPVLLTLARHGQVPLDEVMRAYDRSSAAIRPLAVAAAAHLSPTADIARALKGDSPLHAWVYEWAASLA